MTDKIKSCPFCGGEAKINFSSPYFVKCSKCFAKSGVASTPAFAVINWNTRKPMDRIVEQLEEKIKTIPHIQHWHDQEKCYVNAIEIIQAGGRND